MITIHHLIRSRSDRVVWLMEELGEPYELVSYAREAGMAAPAAYRALHPMGTAPIVDDGDLRLIESGAIIEHLLDRYGHGRLAPPRGTPEHVRYLQWLHFAESSAAFSFLVEGMLSLGDKDAAKPNPFSQLWRDRNDRLMPYLDDELGQRPYFAGAEFTAADIMMGYALGIYERFVRRRSLSDFPNVATYWERVGARPAYARTMALLYPPTQ